MRILVPGGNGQLGRELTALSTPHQIVPVDLPHCDITDPAAVAAQLDGAPFDAVINAAAYTKVDAAESDAETARRVNVEGPRILAAACKERGITLCQLSTDFIFDGTATAPIPEDATPNPLSVYGQTKLDGERAVLDASSRNLVVRTSWLFGHEGPNFVLTMLRLARERGSLRVVADQTGSPTWTGHLAPAIIRLLERGERGVFHLTNSGSTTWWGLATAAVQAAGLDVPVEAITTADYPTPARRPAYSVLDNRRWRDLGEPPLPSWSEGVDQYLRIRV